MTNKPNLEKMLAAQKPVFDAIVNLSKSIQLAMQSGQIPPYVASAHEELVETISEYIAQFEKGESTQ